jgi:hypothetical protein
MKPETVKMLGKFREILWAVLMMMMLVGVGFEWMDYEIFSAFIIPVHQQQYWFLQPYLWCYLFLCRVHIAVSFVLLVHYLRLHKTQNDMIKLILFDLGGVIYTSDRDESVKRFCGTWD